jgi:hypothetical protein
MFPPSAFLSYTFAFSYIRVRVTEYDERLSSTSQLETARRTESGFWAAPDQHWRVLPLKKTKSDMKNSTPGMWRHVAPAGTYVSEERSASMISVTLFTRMMEGKCSSETSFLTTAKRRHILEDGILNSHSRDNLKYYKNKIFHHNFIHFHSHKIFRIPGRHYSFCNTTSVTTIFGYH